ncbi:CXXC-type zinc finger protein 1 [Branchiostoma belcheri]|nr:CXXC-type zinc finger protein 1 [Branchiostoma belcheri]
MEAGHDIIVGNSTPTPVTPTSCYYQGVRYEPGETIYETTGCLGGGAMCDEEGNLIQWDNFGYKCCLYNEEYYEDGSTFEDEHGNTCHCRASESGEPVPPICDTTTAEPRTERPRSPSAVSGCDYDGTHYEPGETIYDVHGCDGYGAYCDTEGGGVVHWDNEGYGCCVYDEDFYEDGETFTTPDGTQCHCEVEDFSEPVPPRCTSPTLPPGMAGRTSAPQIPRAVAPTPTPFPLGCEYEGRSYAVGETIMDIPGCEGHGAYCDQDGTVIHWDNFGFGCCVHNGQYYQDGDRFTDAQGRSCYCVGSDDADAAPVFCGSGEPPSRRPPAARTSETDAGNHVTRNPVQNDGGRNNNNAPSDSTTKSSAASTRLRHCHGVLELILLLYFLVSL